MSSKSRYHSLLIISPTQGALAVLVGVGWLDGKCRHMGIVRMGIRPGGRGARL